MGAEFQRKSKPATKQIAPRYIQYYSVPLELVDMQGVYEGNMLTDLVRCVVMDMKTIFWNKRRNLFNDAKTTDSPHEEKKGNTQ